MVLLLLAAAFGQQPDWNRYQDETMRHFRDRTSSRSLRSQLYVVGGAATLGGKATSQAGVGGEWVGGRGVGVGGEAGFVAGHRSFGLVLASVSYHFPASIAGGKLDPFVTGGVGGAIAPLGSGGAASFGAGLNYWIRRRLGLRLEIRDVLVGGPRENLVGFRAGVALR